MKSIKPRSTALILSLFTIGGFLNFAFAETNEAKEIKKIEQSSLLQVPAIKRLQIEYKGEGLRDPFKGYMQEGVSGSAATVSTAPPDLELQGIVWGGRLPQAIINNKVVKVGDTIQEARIIDINKEGVTVFLGGAQYTISSPAVNELKKMTTQKSKGGQDE